MSAVMTSCPVTRATPMRSAASRCQTSSARCMPSGRSTVRRVRRTRVGCAATCPSPVSRWVGPVCPGSGGVPVVVCRANRLELGALRLGLILIAATLSGVQFGRSVYQYAPVEHLSIDSTVERSRRADGARVVAAVLTVAPVHAGTPRGERRKYARRVRMRFGAHHGSLLNDLYEANLSITRIS